MNQSSSLQRQLVQFLVERFQASPLTQAIGLGGSQAGGTVDAASDVDLYVFTQGVMPLSLRNAIQQARGASRADMDLQFWDLGDEWIDAPTGIEVDVVYWDTGWIAAQVDRVVVQHQAWMGYTTCFWHTIRHLQPLFDRHGWLAQLQKQAARSYPEALRRAIVAKNHAVLRNVIPSYLNQIEKAVRRGDLVSVNHRLAALFASYFDVLFALNYQTNPGEKKLVALAQQTCPRQPARMAEEIAAVLGSAGAPEQGLMDHLNHLLDSLDALLAKEGFDPKTSQPLKS